MKINVALFITALSTTAAASAGDDGAATTNKLGDEIEAVVPSSSTLRASSSLLKDNVFAKNPPNTPRTYCPLPVTDQSTSDCSLDCSGCDNPWTQCQVFDSCGDGEVTSLNCYTYKCCNGGNTSCYEGSAQADEEDAVMINADKEEKKVPQDTTTSDKLGAPSSALRASSLLKNNVFAKEGAEDFLDVGECPAAGWNAEACPADYCADCNGKTHCKSRFIPCPQDSICVTERNYLLCCNANGNNCNGEFPDMEDAVMIIPQDTDKLDASSPLRASLLKVE